MKIPLNDPIWSRVYGPYGVQNVNKDLANLMEKWDSKLADDLYFEKLHHQDDLYPVTYAALPWLWDMRNASGSYKIDLLCFISHAISCATMERLPSVPDGKFWGLTPDRSTHSEFQTKLLALENWFETNVQNMANTCVDAIPAADKGAAFYLCSGFLNIRQAENLSLALGLWHSEEKMSDILEEAPPKATDVGHVHALLARLNGSSTALTEFLSDWLSELDIAFSDHPDQMKLI